MKRLTQSQLNGYFKGVEVGELEGKVELLLKVLKNRYGDMSMVTQVQLRKLSHEQLVDLLLALLDFQSKADLHRWLRKKASQVVSPARKHRL